MGFDDYAPKRESSRQALGAFFDTADSYLRELDDGVRQRIRTFSEDTPSDISFAVSLLSKIRNAGIVIHGPRGCASFAPAVRSRRGSLPVAVTNLTEQDTILGAENQLRETLEKYIGQTKAELIFVVTTPPVSINSDDAGAVIAEVESAYGITVVGVLTTGFQSRLGITGYDCALLPLFNRLAGDRDDGEPFVNLISVSEHPAETAYIAGLIKNLGIGVNALPATGCADSFRRAGAAKASVLLNAGDGLLLAEKLKEEFGVDFLAPPLPLGDNGAFLKVTADFLGFHFEPEDTAARIPELRGRKVFVEAQPLFAAALAKVIADSGGEVAGICLPYLDSTAASLLTDYREKLLVGEQQGFELENIFAEMSPDLFLSQSGLVAPAVRRGIPAASFGTTPVLLPDGWVFFKRRIRSALRNSAFAIRLRQDSPDPYSESWLRRRVNWYIKQEVL